MQNVGSEVRRSGVDRQDEAPNVAVAQKGHCLLTEVLKSLSKEGSLLGGCRLSMIIYLHFWSIYEGPFPGDLPCHCLAEWTTTPTTAKHMKFA